MSSIFDAFSGGEFVDGFPPPAEAQFPELDELSPGDTYEFAVKGHDMKLVSIRGTKNTTNYEKKKAHVLNVRVKLTDGPYADLAGEADAFWFTEDDFDENKNEWHETKKKKAASLGKLLEATGCLSPEAFAGADLTAYTPGQWMDLVAVLVDAAAKYQGGYEFNGTIKWKRYWKEGKPKAYDDVAIFFNKTPAVETPF